MNNKRLQEIKDDIERGRKNDVPDDWDCNYEQVYNDKEELVIAVEQAWASRDTFKERLWNDHEGARKCIERLRTDNQSLRAQLAEARAKIERLELTEYGAFDR